MITVSVEFKDALPGSKVKARAEVGLLGLRGNVLSMLTYTEGIPQNMVQRWGVEMEYLAEDLATGYL